VPGDDHEEETDDRTAELCKVMETKNGFILPPAKNAAKKNSHPKSH
jgi:hypothetical protein